MLKIVRSLESLRDKAYSKKERIIDDFPQIDTEHDARITTFSKFINVTNSSQLGLTFAGQHLLSSNWWKKTARKDIPDQEKSIYINEFENFTKLGFVQFIFSSTESGLRLILKAINSQACNNGTAAFKSIYECLLRSKLSQYPKESVELLDLLRLNRNTIHNNGVYFHKSGNNESVTYDGTTYDFKIGKPVDFVTWDFIIEISEDILDLLDKIVRDQNVASINQTINDPFSHS